MVTVGKIRDAHGLKGEVFVVMKSEEASWSPDLKDVVLVRKELGEDGWKPVSHRFHVKRTKPHKNGLLVLLEELTDRTQAESFQGALFQIPETHLVSKPGETIFLREILGFKVVAGSHEGVIEGFSSNGAQDLLEVRTGDGVFSVPFVEAFVEKLDFKNKLLSMNLPKGLLTPIDSSSSPDDADEGDED